MQILFVDDDSDLVEVARLALNSEKCQLLCARNLAEARQHISVSEIRGLIVDAQLGDGSGLDLVSEVRVPCVVISGDSQLEAPARARGAVSFLLKPISLEQLRGAVAKLRQKGGSDVSP